MDNKTRKNFWTTIPGVLTGLAALIVAITGLYGALRDHPQTAPGPPEDQAATVRTQYEETTINQAREVSLEQKAHELGSRFISAYQSDRISSILAVTDVPFYIFGDFVYRRDDLRDKLELFFSQKDGNFRVLGTRVKRLEDIRQQLSASQQVDDYNVSLSSVIQTLALGDSDFLMEIDWSIQTFSGIQFLLMRVKNDNMVLAGWTSTE